MSDNKRNTISVNDVMKETVIDNTVTDVEWGNLTLHVKERLSLMEVMEFVSDVVDSCFAENTDEYLPEVKDFVFNTYILKYYAGIDMDADLSEIYDLIYGSDLVSLVTGYIDNTQLCSISDAIDNKIGVLLRTRTGSLNMQMGDLLSKFEALEETLSGIFEGVDKDTVSKLAESISNGSFDMNKVVQAYITNKNGKEKSGR